jgi:hypothetical protein
VHGDLSARFWKLVPAEFAVVGRWENYRIGSKLAGHWVEEGRSRQGVFLIGKKKKECFLDVFGELKHCMGKSLMLTVLFQG